MVRGGYRISYYPQKLQDWVGSQSSSVPVGASFSNSVTNTALSPDGLPNYGLRSVPQYIAGVNTPDSIINTNDTRLLARGFNVGLLDPHHTDGRVQDWNLTFEKEILDNTVMRIGYIGNYGDKQQQEVHYNDATPDYIWYATTQTPLPTGAFANVATRPYDQQAYGNITLYAPTGYGRYNGVQVELERRFNKGFGFQIFWNHGNTYADQPRHRRHAERRCDAEHQHVPAGRGSRGLRRAEPVPELQARPQYAEAPDPLEFHRRTAHRAGQETARQFQGHRGEDRRRLAGCRHRQHACRDGGACRPITIRPAIRSRYYGFKYPIQDCTSGSCFPGYL